MKTHSSLLVGIGIVAVTLGLSCAQAQVGVSNGSGGDQGPGGGGNGGSTGIFIDTDAAVIQLPDARKPQPDLPTNVEPFGYDDKGTPICLSILSLGQPARYGDQSGGGDSTDAFQNYMNEYTKNADTGTTSMMTMVKQFKSLTADFLSKYNVLVLQALYDNPYDPNGLWKFTDSDVSALREWVEKGGALITMTGYFSDNAVETQPLNKLLSPFGISYNPDDVYGNCPDNMCYCASNSVAFGGWSSDYADNDELTRNLKKVGVFHGRTISCSGSDCQVFAKDSAGKTFGVAKTVGKGHVVAWGDEWVTYTSQWGIKDSQYDGPTYTQCKGYTAKTAYSVPQFWYNIFRWSQPDMQWCFTITVPPEADPGQLPIF